MKSKKMELQEAVNLAEAIGIMIKEKVSFKADVGFDVAMTSASLEKSVKVYNDEKNKLLIKYGEEVKEKSGQYNILADKLKPYNEELKALLEKPVSIKMYFETLTKKDLIGAELPLTFYYLFKDYYKEK